LSAYYDSLPAGKRPKAHGSSRAQGRGQAKRGKTGIHLGARIAARVTLLRVTDALARLPGLAFRGPGSPMHLRRLRDCLELQQTAEDILLQRPTAERRRSREFAAAWRLDAPTLKRRMRWDGAIPSVDEIRTSQALKAKYGVCTGVGSWMDDVGCADKIGGPDRYDRDYARRTMTFRLPLRTSGRSPLHPFFTTEHDFVWCLPPGPFWWSDALRLVRWSLYLAATEATQQGGSLRLLPPPKVQPDLFQLSDALQIDAADGPALRRVRRLFLGWSYYETPDGYADFGWWDLQGDGTATDTADAEADGEALYDAYDWSDDPAAGACDDNDNGDS
jgi:hypothetical protein